MAWSFSVKVPLADDGVEQKRRTFVVVVLLNLNLVSRKEGRIMRRVAVVRGYVNCDIVF